jgi:hypothetical protein
VCIPNEERKGGTKNHTAPPPPRIAYFNV